MAIESKKQLLDHLEDDSVVLNKDFQDTIIKNINLAEKNGRYINSDELVTYFKSFFSNFFMGTGLAAKGKSQILLTLSNDARNSFVNYKEKYLPGQYTLLGRSGQSVLCNFDLSEEDNIHGIHELIEPNHPLIRWMAYYTQENKFSLNGCAALHFTNKSDIAIDDGLYVYYIQEWENKGYRIEDEMQYILCNIDSQKIIGNDIAEELFMQNLFRCREITQYNSVYQQKKEKIMLALDIATKTMAELCYANAMRFKETHNLTIQRKRDNLEMMTKRKKENIEEQIRNLESNGDAKQKRILPLLRSKIKSTMEFYEIQKRDIESKQKTGDQSTPLACGLVKIGV
jgi:hypothetical protein